MILAAKIFPVVKNQHLLLCTLLIGNSLAMEVRTWFFVAFKLLKAIELFLILIIFPVGSSRILGQTGASLGSDSDICHSHPHVWRGRLVHTSRAIKKTSLQIMPLLELNIFQFFVFLHHERSRYCLKQSVVAMAWLLEQRWRHLSIFFSFYSTQFLIQLVRWSWFVKLYSDYGVCINIQKLYLLQVGEAFALSSLYDIWNSGSWLDVG